ncbi:hypothetical protein [Stenoxybacter acetivorans]|uniref:hypothetical protein n=1 Tax=Stenoxybacter acetivorans TaxID=422441 RepID=UPI0005616F60|nr:hypothetical protein [Stenoxybacter acetivorans]
MKQFNNILLFGLLCFNLTGCMGFLISDDDYFAEAPAKYLVNGKGQYIDKNGNRVDSPVLNPYFEEFNKNPTVIKVITPK